jgi:hypothetical protein
MRTIAEIVRSTRSSSSWKYVEKDSITDSCQFTDGSAWCPASSFWRCVDGRFIEKRVRSARARAGRSASSGAGPAVENACPGLAADGVVRVPPGFEISDRAA